MKLSRKVLVCLGVTFAAAIVGGCVAIALTSQNQDELEIADISDVDFKEYYEEEKKDSDQFNVTNVLVRKDGNFLQGFYYDSERQQFAESAGLYKKSRVQWLETSSEDQRVMQPETATRQELDDAYFGEGLSPRNENEFVVLTWKERIVFRLDRTSLELNSEEFTLPQEIDEGWGITADESQKSASGNYRLYVSDGSDRIFEVDGDDFTILKTITVRNQDGTSQDDINELEFVDGSIYANVWY